MNFFFDLRGNESLNFYETERITDIRALDKKTIVIDTMYTTNKREFSRSFLVDITPDNLQYIKWNLLKNQTDISEVKRLSNELYNILTETFIYNEQQSIN